MRSPVAYPSKIEACNWSLRMSRVQQIMFSEVKVWVIVWSRRRRRRKKKLLCTYLFYDWHTSHTLLCDYSISKFLDFICVISTIPKSTGSISYCESFLFQILYQLHTLLHLLCCSLFSSLCMCCLVCLYIMRYLSLFACISFKLKRY